MQQLQWKTSRNLYLQQVYESPYVEYQATYK